MNLSNLVTVFLVLFSVIDSVGTLPFIIHLKRKEGKFNNLKVTGIAGILMILFFIAGDNLLNMMGLDIGSFAMAGAAVMFLSALEMILGISFSKDEHCNSSSEAIVPLAFPMLAGAGTLTTLLSLKSVYTTLEIIIPLLLNIGVIYAVLKSSDWIDRKIGCGGFAVLRKVFGIVVLAMAFKIFKNSFDANF